MTTENERGDGAVMGACSVCGRRFYLRKNGTVWHHAKYPSWWCGGAGQPPLAAPFDGSGVSQ